MEENCRNRLTREGAPTLACKVFVDAPSLNPRLESIQLPLGLPLSSFLLLKFVDDSAKEKPFWFWFWFQCSHRRQVFDLPPSSLVVFPPPLLVDVCARSHGLGH